MTFDLDDAIRSWLRGLRSSRALEAGDVAEFEAHVQDEVADLVRGAGVPGRRSGLLSGPSRASTFLTPSLRNHGRPGA